MSDIDENLPPAAKDRKPPLIVARCGECLFFSASAVYSKPCSQLGVATTGRICGKFMPNVYKTLDMALVNSLMALSSAQLRMVCGLAHQEVKTRKTKNAAYGKRVYIRLVGGDYLSNYRVATILAADETHYFLMSENENTGIKATVLKDSVIFEENWPRKQKLLKAKKRLVDPDYKQYFKTKPRVGINYEPPSIDDFDVRPPADDSETSSVVSVRGKR